MRKKTHVALLNQKNLELTMKNLNIATLANNAGIENVNAAGKKFVELLKSSELPLLTKRVKSLLNEVFVAIEELQTTVVPSRRISEQRFPLLCQQLAKRRESINLNL